MKVCVIGDIHGTTKFIECYKNILTNDNDCSKIIVCGDHFDPYNYIDYETMVERYNEFIDCCKNDDRIVSLLGNHDLDGYVISGCTNRTASSRTVFQAFSDCIKNNLEDSYIVYRIGNWLFSHAGVSAKWLERVKEQNPEWFDQVMNNHKGFEIWELEGMCGYYNLDYSGYGDHPYQGPTWIRPDSLVANLPEGYNQAVGHTQVKKIVNLKDEDPYGKIKTDVWMVDNQRKPEYLVLNIDESE